METRIFKNIIIIGLFTLAFGLGTANADILRVPSKDYPTIQSALDAAFSGDQVFIAAGRYEENITINSLVDLAGAGQNKTVITVGSAKYLPIVSIKIQAPTTISDLTIEGGQNGIDIAPESIATINNVTIIGTKGYGINCDSSALSLSNVNIAKAGSIGIDSTRSDINMVNTTITDTGGDGIKFSSSSFILKNITITGSKGHGIYVNGEPYGTSSREQEIRMTVIKVNQDGIRVNAGAKPDFGTESDPGNNEIYRNRGFGLNNQTDTEINAIGNWWGADPHTH